MAIKYICLIGVIILMMAEQTETYNKYGKVSFADGYWYHFEDGDNDISVLLPCISCCNKKGLTPGTAACWRELPHETCQTVSKSLETCEFYAVLSE